MGSQEATADGVIGRPAGSAGDHGWTLVELDLGNGRRTIVLTVTKNERRPGAGVSADCQSGPVSSGRKHEACHS
jgi:murein DD-endopeptidase MepM/ murein hydrolase activator NlpD